MGAPTQNKLSLQQGMHNFSCAPLQFIYCDIGGTIPRKTETNSQAQWRHSLHWRHSWSRGEFSPRLLRGWYWCVPQGDFWHRTCPPARSAVATIFACIAHHHDRTTRPQVSPKSPRRHRHAPSSWSPWNLPTLQHQGCAQSIVHLAQPHQRDWAFGLAAAQNRIHTRSESSFGFTCSVFQGAALQFLHCILGHCFEQFVRSQNWNGSFCTFCNLFYDVRGLHAGDSKFKQVRSLRHIKRTQLWGILREYWARVILFQILPRGDLLQKWQKAARYFEPTASSWCH